MTPTLAHEPPCCGDPYVVSCDVKDAEGDAVAVTIAMREFGGACLTPERCWTETRSYRPGEIGTGVRMEVHESTVIAAAGSVGGVAGTALTCQAIDSHGSTATVTSCIPLPFAGCP